MSRADRQRPKRESAGGGFGNEAVRIRAIAELARVSTPAVRRSRAHQPARNEESRRDRRECQTASDGSGLVIKPTTRSDAELREAIVAPTVSGAGSRDRTRVRQTRRNRPIRPTTVD